MLRSRTDHDTVLNQTKKPVANWYKQMVKKKKNNNNNNKYKNNSKRDKY